MNEGAEEYAEPWCPTLRTSASTLAPDARIRGSVCAPASPVKSMRKGLTQPPHVYVMCRTTEFSFTSFRPSAKSGSSGARASNAVAGLVPQALAHADHGHVADARRRETIVERSTAVFLTRIRDRFDAQRFHDG